VGFGGGLCASGPDVMGAAGATSTVNGALGGGAGSPPHADSTTSVTRSLLMKES
jgi:hypothetical protein